ncbi:MAG: hypothetical protein EOP84_14205 [Verrucomicrobiaceae bacterium]|nr:MAG: hypothetical protein EOP84_14205 [Verrucomicrobiaceae bacterium]
MSQRSRNVVRDGVKHDVAGILTKAAKALVQNLDSGLSEIFREKSILIPVPRSRPILDGGLWPSLRICEELRKQGVGDRILPCLERTMAAQKSAYAGQGGRLSPIEHLQTLNCKESSMLPLKVVLVDDFVTRGSILLACAALIQAHFPNAEVKAFAMVRTRGFVDDIDKLVDPVVGRISNNFGHPQRDHS